MDTAVVQQLANLQTQVDSVLIPEIGIDLISPYLALPGLVGFWPFSSVQRSTGNVYDISGQNRTLTYNGNPTFNYDGVVPYADIDGVGDYFSRVTETDLNILGTETIYAAAIRGLSMGIWAKFDAITPASFAGVIGKFGAVGNKGYQIFAFNISSQLYFSVSVDGTAEAVVANTTTIIVGRWYFIAVQFIPSTSISIWVNEIKSTNTVAIPASIFSNNNAFQVGTSTATGPIAGNISLPFLCANAVSDAHISKVFESTRGAFGV